MKSEQMKSLLKKGDLVQVISGKEKGKQAKIKEMQLKHESVIVEGLNMVKRHVKPTQTNPQGGIIAKEAPIHISNVMAVCPKTNKPTRLGSKLVNGKKVRVAKKSGATLS